MRLTLLTPLTLAVAMTTAAASCPTSDWQEFFGMCYRASPGPVLWTSVASFCQALYPGSEAAIRLDFTINSFLSDRVMDGETAWIGLCCEGECSQDEDFQWLDGSPQQRQDMWTYHESHGNGTRCAYLNSDSTGQWWGARVDDDPAYPVLCQMVAA